MQSYEQQIKDAKTIIGRQQMEIQTLESTKSDFIEATKERDKHISQLQAETHQLKEEKQHLQDMYKKLKANAMTVFKEVEVLQQRIVTLERQHKTREEQETANLEKVKKFAERFQFMSRMLQRIDKEYQALRREHAGLQYKYNKERESVHALKQKLN